MNPRATVDAIASDAAVGLSAAPTRGLTPGLVAVFAAACGLTVANIFYAQPLIGLIAPALGLHAALAGLVIALTQVGYGTGLLLLVPLSDVTENRRLVTTALGVVVIGLIGIATSRSALVFLAFSFLVGMSAVATQVLVPFISHLAPDASRGKAVGNVMAGLLTGIMLARPWSSYVAATLGWRAVFYISAAMMAALLVVLRRVLPERRPAAGVSYLELMRSLPALVARTPLLRRRAFYQGMMFAGFNVFWTGSPLLLASVFGLDHRGIALFALAGAAGALSAPVAGRLADRGLTRPATGFALLAALVASAIFLWAGRTASLALLVVGALVLDAAVQVCQVLSLRSLYMLAPELRGRLNGLFIAFAFACGATGSALAAAAYTWCGWSALAGLVGVFAVAALLMYASEFGPAPRGAPRMAPSDG